MQTGTDFKILRKAKGYQQTITERVCFLTIPRRSTKQDIGRDTINEIDSLECKIHTHELYKLSSRRCAGASSVTFLCLPVELYGSNTQFFMSYLPH